jgi:ABC-type bacteriocin/lantibiotic exporter with double-glycine peptidase domain
MPIIEIPIVKQKSEHDCGQAVFLAVCKYLRVKLNRPGTTPESDPINGLHPFELEPAFRRLGLAVVAGSMDLDDLRYHAKRSRPVVCLIQFGDSGHWVVSGGVARGRVWIMEPFEGEWRGVPEAEFLAAWRDHDRHGTTFRNYGIAVGCAVGIGPSAGSVGQG